MSKQWEQEDADPHPESFSSNDSTPAGDGIYRPPRLVPVSYDPSRPHLETTSSLGEIPALAESGRAS